MTWLLVAAAHGESWWTRNNGTVIGSSIAVVGILVAIAIAVSQRQPKTLDWTVQANERILTAAARGAHDIRVMVGDMELTNPRLVVLRIFNSGKREIRHDEWDEPIRVRAASGTIASWGFATSFGLTAEDFFMHTILAQHRTSLELPQVLMNPDDWIDLDLLIGGGSDTPGERPVEVESRFAGQTRRMRERYPFSLGDRRTRYWFAALSFFVAVGVGIAANYAVPRNHSNPGGAIFLIPLAILWLSVLLPPLLRRRQQRWYGR